MPPPSTSTESGSDPPWRPPPPPPPAGDRVDRGALRPSRAWYGVAGAILVVGLAGAALLASSVFKSLADVARFSTNRPVEASLQAGDEGTIYTSTATGASSFSPETTCEVVDVATGAAVPTTTAAPVTLTLGDDEFRSMANFEVDHDGRYRVSCSASTARPVPMAVGPRIGIFASIGRVFGAVAVVLVSLALAAATIAVTAVKRSRHRRRLQGLA